MLPGTFVAWWSPEENTPARPGNPSRAGTGASTGTGPASGFEPWALS